MKSWKRVLASVAFVMALGGLFISPYWLPSPQATVNEVTPAANRYTGNGSTTAFTYSFRILTKTDIEVLVDGVVKTVDTDYTVSGLGASGGGTVTFTTAPASGTAVTLLRKQPASQLSDYVPNEAFPSERIEKDFDKLQMLTQQLKEALDRALKFAKKSTKANIDVPDPVADKYLRWDSTGLTLTNAGITNSGSLGLPVARTDGGTGSATGFADVVYCADSATYNAAITAIGANTRTLAIASTCTATATVTAPSNVTHWFIGTGQLSINNLQTVTIKGPIIAAPRQIFSGSGTVSIGTDYETFVRGFPLAVGYAEWWGAKADASTNSSTALAAAISSNIPLQLLNGIYLTDPLELTLVGSKVIKGSGHRRPDGSNFFPSTILRSRGTQATLLKVSGNGHLITDLLLDGNGTTTDVLHVGYGTQTSKVTFSRIGIQGATPATGRLVNLDGGAGNIQVDFVTFEHCLIEQTPSLDEAQRAVWSQKTNTMGNTFKNCRISGAQNLVRIEGGSINLNTVDFGTTSSTAIQRVGGADLSVRHCYTEVASHIFIDDASIITATHKTELVDNRMNNTSITWNLMAAGNTVLMNNHWNGTVNIKTPSSGDPHPVIAIGNHFASGDFGGSQGVAALVEINTLTSDATPVRRSQISGRVALVPLSPAQITADQNNYHPGFQGLWRLSSDASRNITGIANGLDGQKLTLINVGAFNIVVQNQNVGSSAGNRIITGTGADVTLAPDDTAELFYDNTTARWRITNTY